MKSIIFGLLVVVSAVPVMASAQSLAPVEIAQVSSGWQNVTGHVSFTNATDELFVEVDGYQVFTSRPQTIIVSVAGGESHRHEVVTNINWNFDLNVDAGDHTMNVYVESQGVRKLIKLVNFTK